MAVIGGARDPFDRSVFHKISLIALFAWIGLGADGISSSSYGPEEAFVALGQHIHLAVFVALATAITIVVISSSYSQIAEVFPAGGGGYVVASKLLNPTLGMVSGCALLIDYILTVAVSIASGADAIFSFLPAAWYPYKIVLAVAGVCILAVLNLRGVRESVVPLVPILGVFVCTHAFVIVYALVSHAGRMPEVAAATSREVSLFAAGPGLFAMVILILRAYSMGAGTFTGIEAVSNAMPILRDPKVETAKKTMSYMAASLSVVVVGLIVAYLLYQVAPIHGKTLNAILFDKMTAPWGRWGYVFVLVTLLSEALLLFAAAQTGFLGGPRVLANMAIDHWVPTRFALFSDRLVNKNGILLMSAAALATILLSGGSVRILVVLYSINVFITFTLSQLGMVRHWWQERGKAAAWLRKLGINGLGLIMSAFILISVSVLKFHEGGWVTLFVTGTFAAAAFFIRRHYQQTSKLLRRLDNLVMAAVTSGAEFLPEAPAETRKCPDCDQNAKTAVILVNGFNGLGLHTLFSVMRVFGGIYRNFVFVHIGIIDAGTFKGAEEVRHLKEYVQAEVDRYVEYVRSEGYYAEGYSAVGTDVVDEVEALAPKLLERFPQAVFFGGQLVFPEESFLLRILHNNIVFAVQRRFYHLGIPFVILPVRV